MDTQLDRVFVGKGPANVVVAAHVVDPGRVGVEVVALLQGLLQQVHLAGGQAVPQQSHLQRVVRELALLGRDVLDHIVRVHDGLALEQHAGRGNAHQRAERADHRVRLGQVLAHRAQAFPHKGHRVHAQNLGAQVGNRQHFARHGGKHGGVAVVQVPLETVEGGPHPATIGQLRERAGVLVGEDLAHGLVVRVGQRAVGEDVVKIRVLRVARHRTRGPGVLVRGVVKNKVQHQADALGTQRGGQVLQVFHLAQGRVHLAVAADRVAAVAVAVGALEQRHQVQIRQPQLLEVRNLLLQTLEVARVQVHVTHAAQHLLRLEPARVFLALHVQRLQIRRAGVPGIKAFAQQVHQKVQKVGPRAVQRGQLFHQLREVCVQPGRKCVPRLARRLGLGAGFKGGNDVLVGELGLVCDGKHGAASGWVGKAAASVREPAVQSALKHRDLKPEWPACGTGKTPVLPPKIQEKSGSSAYGIGVTSYDKYSGCLRPARTRRALESVFAVIEPAQARSVVSSATSSCSAVKGSGSL